MIGKGLRRRRGTMANVFFSKALIVAVGLSALVTSLSAQDKEVAGPKIVPTIKRRDLSSEEELRLELLAVPELGFDRSEALRIKGKLESVEQVAGIQVSNDVGIQNLQQTALRL